MLSGITTPAGGVQAIRCGTSLFCPFAHTCARRSNLVVLEEDSPASENFDTHRSMPVLS